MTPEAVIPDRRSLKHFEGPDCPACQLEMRWTRSRGSGNHLRIYLSLLPYD
jgi:hypothetical protein